MYVYPVDIKCRPARPIALNRDCKNRIQAYGFLDSYACAYCSVISVCTSQL